MVVHCPLAEPKHVDEHDDAAHRRERCRAGLQRKHRSGEPGFRAGHGFPVGGVERTVLESPAFVVAVCVNDGRQGDVGVDRRVDAAGDVGARCAIDAERGDREKPAVGRRAEPHMRDPPWRHRMQAQRNARLQPQVRLACRPAARVEAGRVERGGLVLGIHHQRQMYTMFRSMRRHDWLAHCDRKIEWRRAGCSSVSDVNCVCDVRLMRSKEVVYACSDRIALRI